ncbi:hypothetical protein G6F57_015621 [Rhizopus arrhizus]|nr:hypothetical protein G6F57_015621 [Rhizopus arrhizus]
MQLVAVHADAVDRRHEAQVLDGPRTQQRLPRVGTRRRPVGDEDLQVEVQLPGALDVVAVAAEHREAQVVADQRIDPPALPLHAQALAAGGIALVFAAIAEQTPSPSRSCTLPITAAFNALACSRTQATVGPSMPSAWAMASLEKPLVKVSGRITRSVVPASGASNAP